MSRSVSIPTLQTLLPSSERNPAHPNGDTSTANPIPLMKPLRALRQTCFVHNGRWLKGVVFLLTTKSEWADHALESIELTENDQEIKQEPKSFAVSVSKVYASVVCIVKRLSSWIKLLKFIALCLHCQRDFEQERESLARMFAEMLVPSAWSQCLVKT